MKIITHNEYAENIDKYPDICPHCHKYQIPKYISGLDYYNFGTKIVEAFFQCTNSDCNKGFIAYYYKGVLREISIGVFLEKEFSEIIKTISPQFSIIYNQAYFAQQNMLDQITGVGYRKALEFLIKDYAIKNNPSEEKSIKKTPLMQVINKHIGDTNIKNVAKRAVWLGNDETHYIRVWEDKDLSFLKQLIDLTIHWIEAEELTKTMMEEMPDNKNVR